MKEHRVVCGLCPHHCELTEGQTGLCAARTNVGGKIACTNYGKLTSIALDPIEKKPLCHFHPGSLILSVGSYGCNLLCPFCQNHEISRAKAGELRVEHVPPEALAQLAEDTRTRYGNIGVAFTYNEPLVSYEYLIDCAKLLHEKNLAVVLVTNGQICSAPLEKLLPHVNAMNIDLKGFTQAFYDWIGSDLETTKTAIQRAFEANVHVEVTTLAIPGRNDNEKEMDVEAHWLASISPEIPLHLSRYFPRYHCDIPMTPVEQLQRLQSVAQKYLHHVHLGNV
jgi:pyruvate formate lyase activating enzyme